MDDRVMIARLGRPHGVRGEIRAHPTGPTLGSLAEGGVVWVRRGDDVRSLTLTSTRELPGWTLVTFREIETREAAGELVNATLEVDASRLADLDASADEFYVRDLIGCAVNVDGGGPSLGVVADVHEGAANDALVVRSEAGEAMVPFTHDAVVRMDLPARVIVVRAGLMDGLDA